MPTDWLEKLEAAPKWVGLTDEELLELSKDAWGRNKLHLGRSDHTGFYIDFGRDNLSKPNSRRRTDDSD
jgi:hypothetical protein